LRVYVTGGTGLIGSHVAERLRHRGDDVVALVRPTSETSFLEARGATLVQGDVLDEAGELARSMRGADAVVHAAAIVFRRVRRRTFERVNIDGTVRVLEAAAAANVPRVVHVSSVAVYYRREPAAIYRERDWEAEVPRRVVYAYTKQASERRAWALHREGRIRLTTVRPSVVYGERDRAATPIVARYASLPLVPLPAGGNTTVPVVYAGNVARGIVAALDRPSSVGRAYNLAMDEPLTLRALLDGFARGLGRTPRFATVPAAPGALAARAVDLATSLAPGIGRTRARRGVHMLTHDNPYDSARARLELGWTSLVPHEVALRRTAEWWKRR